MSEVSNRIVTPVARPAASQHAAPDAQNLPKIIEKRPDQKNDEQLDTIMAVIQSLAGSVGKGDEEMKNLLEQNVSQRSPFNG